MWTLEAYSRITCYCSFNSFTVSFLAKFILSWVVLCKNSSWSLRSREVVSCNFWDSIAKEPRIFFKSSYWLAWSSTSFENSFNMSSRIKFSRMMPSTVIGLILAKWKNSRILLMFFACYTWVIEIPRSAGISCDKVIDLTVINLFCILLTGGLLLLLLFPSASLLLLRFPQKLFIFDRSNY